MVKTLQRYVLREVGVPTLLTILTLIFVMIIRMVFTQAEHLAGAVTISTLGQFMLYLLPALLSQAVPMALLIGVLLGIGRLTVDSEIKAMRAHGVNLFQVFLPLLAIGAFLSALILHNSLQTGPDLLTRSMTLLDQAKFEIINSLQPGRPYDNFGLTGSDTDVIIYFDSKDEGGRMHNVYVSIQGGLAGYGDEIEDREVARKIDTSASESPLPTLAAISTESSVNSGEAPDLSKIFSLWTAQETTITHAENLLRIPLAPASEIDVESAETTADIAETKTLILASSGKIEGNPENQQATLDLYEGSVHFLRGRSDPRYTVVDFKRLQQNFDLDIRGSSQESGRRKIELMTLGEILWEIDWRQSRTQRTIDLHEEQNPGVPLDKRDLIHKRVHQMYAEIYSRISNALACFAFVLIGIPLAILAKPSGKSIGITIAFFIILVFQGFTRFGVELTRSGAILGPAVIFIPNVLLTITGALMFHRSVHR